MIYIVQLNGGSIYFYQAYVSKKWLQYIPFTQLEMLLLDKVEYQSFFSTSSRWCILVNSFEDHIVSWVSQRGVNNVTGICRLQLLSVLPQKLCQFITIDIKYRLSQFHDDLSTRAWECFRALIRSCENFGMLSVYLPAFYHNQK